MTSSSTSVTSEPLLLSSRSAGHSLQSPQLQAEFLQGEERSCSLGGGLGKDGGQSFSLSSVFQDKFQSRRDIRESSVVSPMSSVFSPSPSPTSPLSSPFTPSPISPTLSSPSCSSSSPSSPCYDNRRGELVFLSPNSVCSPGKDHSTHHTEYTVNTLPWREYTLHRVHK